MRYIIIIDEINKQARLPNLKKAINLAKQIKEELGTSVRIYDTFAEEFIEF